MRARVLFVAGAVLSVSGVPGSHGAELLLIRGEGDHVGVTAAAIRTQAWKTWTRGERWSYTLAPEWQVGFWGAQKSNANESRIVDSSLTGVLTLRPRSSATSPYYLDIGFGIHLLSNTRIGDERNFGSSFQFGEFLGLGVEFGERRRYSLAARVQHVSNGGIKRPNPGVTFAQILMTYRF